MSIREITVKNEWNTFARIMSGAIATFALGVVVITYLIYGYY